MATPSGRRVRFLIADVFTDKPFAGNQLAVVPDGRGLSTAQMAALAREFNFSETVFAFPPDDSRHTRRLRIFAPTAELPFAGHPTVGTAYVLAAIGDIPLTGEHTRIVFEEGVGPVPVLIRARGGSPEFTELSAAKLPETRPAPDGATLASVLSLDARDLRSEDQWQPAIVSCGVPFILVPVRDRGVVARAQPRMDAWRALDGGWSREVMVFAMDGERPGSQVRARMFAPMLGVIEDPATGSACASLGGYLASRSGSGDDTRRWVVEQGFEMGRPSILEVEADVSGGAVRAVRVGGASVLIAEGTVAVPS